MSYKIGITGNIACGKSLVKGFLEEMSIPVIDADDIVHRLLKSDKQVIEQVSEIFGREMVVNGEIDRPCLAQVVFGQNDKLKELEKILHPLVYKEIEAFLSSNTSDIVAVVIPLLFETQAQKLFDTVWLVTADYDKQVARLKHRNNMSDKEINRRIACQMSQDEKKKLANLVIDNNSSIENLKNQILKVIYHTITT